MLLNCYAVVLTKLEGGVGKSVDHLHEQIFVVLFFLLPACLSVSIAYHLPLNNLSASR